MKRIVSRQSIEKVRRMAALAEEARKGPFAVSVTRLTVLKGLCKEPDVAVRFVTFLARKTLDRLKRKKASATDQTIKR